jgi:hypothetical protein
MSLKKVDIKGKFQHNSGVEGMGGISHGASDFGEYLKEFWDSAGCKGF